MIRYKDLVEYIKVNHVNWDTELFSVLRDFFEWYMVGNSSSVISLPDSASQDLVFQFPADSEKVSDFIPPESGEYTTEDLLKLFST